MRKIVALTLAGTLANAAWAGPAALGVSMGSIMGVTMGQVFGGPLGIAMPVAGGGVFLIAAASLAVGIRIVRRKQNRQRKEPLQ